MGYKFRTLKMAEITIEDKEGNKRTKLVAEPGLEISFDSMDLNKEFEKYLKDGEYIIAVENANVKAVREKPASRKSTNNEKSSENDGKTNVGNTKPRGRHKKEETTPEETKQEGREDIG